MAPDVKATTRTRLPLFKCWMYTILIQYFNFNKTQWLNLLTCGEIDSTAINRPGEVFGAQVIKHCILTYFDINKIFRDKVNELYGFALLAILNKQYGVIATSIELEFMKEKNDLIGESDLKELTNLIKIICYYVPEYRPVAFYDIINAFPEAVRLKYCSALDEKNKNSAF